MPKPILKPPLAINAPGHCGWGPSTGARLVLRGRTPAQRAITGAAANCGNVTRARSIRLSSLASVAVGSDQSRSDVEPSATVPSSCGTRCSPSANNCGRDRASWAKSAACPFSPAPSPGTSVNPVWPVAHRTGPSAGPSAMISPPSCRTAAASAMTARRGWMRALRLSLISQPLGAGGDQSAWSVAGTTCQCARPCHRSTDALARVWASANPVAVTGCNRPVRAYPGSSPVNDMTPAHQSSAISRLSSWNAFLSDQFSGTCGASAPTMPPLAPAPTPCGSITRTTAPRRAQA